MAPLSASVKLDALTAGVVSAILLLSPHVRCTEKKERLALAAVDPVEPGE